MSDGKSFGLGCLLGGLVAPVVFIVILFFSFGPLINLWVKWKTGAGTSWPDPTVVRMELGHNRGPAPRELTIAKAQYGADDAWIDVTALLQGSIQDNALSVRASNELADDPLFGVMKTLVVEYVVDGRQETLHIPEGGFLEIPEFAPIDSAEDLVALVKRCPAEVGFYGVNFTTGTTVEHRPDQPACMASIVKLFTLLEVMSQVRAGQLNLSDSISINGRTVTIDEALDLMIGLSDNDATAALTSRVGYERVNALPRELGMTGLSDQILPAPGILDGVLDRRLSGSRTLSLGDLPPQHATARGMVQFLELLHENRLLSSEISSNVLVVLDRHPRGFVPHAPAGFSVVGKGGGIGWKRPGKRQYNMMGWDVYLRDKNVSLGFCLWCEWFPEQMPEDLRGKWCFAISDGIASVLLGHPDEREGLHQ